MPQKFPYTSIAVLGGGESGTGAALLAKAKGLHVFLSDAGTIQPEYKAALLAAGIDFEEGGHDVPRICQAQTLLKSPGIPPIAPPVVAAQAAGLVVMDELELAGCFMEGQAISITGSNGKTTTTLLTYHLLKEAGFDVGLGGNIGKSLAAQLAEGYQPKWWVLEVSSFQLDGLITFHPNVAILLNITPDHLDRYGTMEAYAASKLSIAKNQTAEDVFISFADGGFTQQKVSQAPIKAHKVAFGNAGAPNLSAWAEEGYLRVRANGRQLNVPLHDLPLQGAHNHLNMAAAGLAALTVGADPEKITQAFTTFRNAPHRLEPVADIDGIRFINDSKATNLDSVRYALAAVPEPIVWIAGGKDKGNDYAEIKDIVLSKVKALICLTKYPEPLLKAFKDVIPQIQVTESVTEAVRISLALAQAGDTVLLSPACASFDLFKNYEDRGNQFREAAQALAGQNVRV